MNVPVPVGDTDEVVIKPRGYKDPRQFSWSQGDLCRDPSYYLYYALNFPNSSLIHHFTSTPNGFPVSYY